MGVSRRHVLRWGGAAVITTAGVALGRYLSGPGGRIVAGRSRAVPVQGDAVVPASTDVVVIGGGIVGACAALELAERGLGVVLCEKGAIGGEASGRAQGVVSSAGLAPFKLDLINRAKALWEGLSERIQRDPGYRHCGVFTAFDRTEDADFWADWIKAVGQAAPQAKMLGSVDANRMLPSRQRWAGAFLDPSDGGAEPAMAASAIAEGARRKGATILVPCAVRSLEMSAGRVSAVVTERGTIRAGAVVVAGGNWSTRFMADLGIRLPSVDMFSSLLRVTFAADARELPALFRWPGATLRRQVDGSYALGSQMGRVPITPQLMRNLWSFRRVIVNPPWRVHPHLGGYFFHEHEHEHETDEQADAASIYERTRILQPSDNEDVFAHVQQRVRDTFPELAAGMRVVERWSGALNVTPDNIPVISAVAERPGLYVATGFTYGLTMGPAAGQFVADLVTGARASVDLHPYRVARFVDGSPLLFTH